MTEIHVRYNMIECSYLAPAGRCLLRGTMSGQYLHCGSSDVAQHIRGSRSLHDRYPQLFEIWSIPANVLARHEERLSMLGPDDTRGWKLRERFAKWRMSRPLQTSILRVMKTIQP